MEGKCFLVSLMENMLRKDVAHGRGHKGDASAQ